MQDETLLDVRDTARLFHVHESKIYDLAKQGKIPFLRVGASLRFERSALMEWVHQQTVMPARANVDEAL